jgi:uncharacterized protein YndB with AHSA1/START domain
MPAHKDFKRLVRARMEQTGESYTSARSQLLRRKPARVPASPRPHAATPAIAYATLAGMSDAVIKGKTGCDWARWVWALDRVEAHTWPHRQIAAYVQQKYKVPDWWTQAVTVGYERIKGLRAIGQRRSGAYEATKSKVFAVPLARLFRAFRDARTRRRWLDGIDLTIRGATAGKRMRIGWPDQSVVEVNFVAKSDAKSQVAIQHGKLPDATAAAKMKAFWAERLAALAEML